jgi:hypothetical protein
MGQRKGCNFNALICLDVVSKITCVLAFELKAIPKSFIEHFLEMRAVDTANLSAVYCICGISTFKKGSMIRCNLCMRYSHCHCVALSDGYRGTFKCHACVDSVAKENDEDNETLFSVVEEIYVTLYEIICDYLVAGQKEAAFLTFQAQYISELLKVPEAHKTTTAKSLKKLYEFIEKSKSPGIYSSIDQYEIRTVCRALSAFRTPNSYRGMLELVLRLVLKSLTDPSSVVRTKAVRVLAVLVEANPPLLFQENIRSVLQARFRDKTISVREAAISLVGPFLLSYPDQTELYFPPILDRLQVDMNKPALPRSCF